MRTSPQTPSPYRLALAIFFTFTGATTFAQFGATASIGEVGLLNNDALRDSGNDQQPHIATDAKGNWVAVWQTDQTSSSGGESRIELRWAISSDGGLNWSEPATVNSEGRSSGQSDTSPVVATNGKGDWVLMWISPGSGSTTQNGTSSDLFAARSTNNGRTWSVPQRIETPPQDVAEGSAATSDVDLTLSTSGDTWIAIWSSERDIAGGGGSHAPNDAVLLTTQSFDDGVSWTTAGSFTRYDGQRDSVPALAAGDRGLWMAIWTAGTSIVYSESIDDGLTFTEPTVLPNSTGGANAKVASSSSPQTKSAKVTGSAGQERWMVAYARAGDVLVTGSPQTAGSSSTTGANRSWSQPTTIGSGVNASLSAGMDDSWIVGWEQAGSFGDDIDILVSRSSDGGTTWQTPTPLDPDASRDNAEDLGVRMASDGLGSWLAIWFSGSDTRGAGTDEDIHRLAFTFAADCDNDGVGDPQESRIGDCDGDGVPDDCDSDACSPNGQNGGGSIDTGGGSTSGGGACGTGAMGMLPLMFTGLGSFHVRTRRKRANVAATDGVR